MQGRLLDIVLMVTEVRCHGVLQRRHWDVLSRCHQVALPRCHSCQSFTEPSYWGFMEVSCQGVTKVSPSFLAEMSLRCHADDVSQREVCNCVLPKYHWGVLPKCHWGVMLRCLAVLLVTIVNLFELLQTNCPSTAKKAGLGHQQMVFSVH